MVVVALENVLALDIGIPWQVFGSWRDGPYTLTVCAERPGLVPMHGGPRCPSRTVWTPWQPPTP